MEGSRSLVDHSSDSEDDEFFRKYSQLIMQIFEWNRKEYMYFSL